MEVMRLLLVGLSLAACTHERPLSTLHHLAGERVTLEILNGLDVEAHVEQTADGVAYRSETGYVPAANVTRVIEKRRGRGALEGLGIGALIGAASGAIIGFADGDDVCPETGWCLFQFTAGEKAFMAGTFLGGLGAGLGAVIGLVHGSHFVYSYGEQQIRVMPTGPPGSFGGVTITF
jgi:hypothetical protein